MLDHFINQIRTKLEGELPGENAQRLMMPVESTRARFDLNRPDAKRGGVLILFYAKSNSIFIPLTQRHDYGGTHGGQVSLPGGKMEKQDSSIIDTALRETHEEIGIHSKKIQVLGQLSDLYIPPSNFQVTPVVGFIDEEPDFNLDAYEVKELIEAPLTDLLDAEKKKTKDIEVRGGFRINAPYFDIKGRVVWGATAMILSELHQIVSEIKPFK